MDKRYQVFISSTYLDLTEERRNVTQTVFEAGCIPAGMELFPAADESQLKFIKRVIDDCDYYLLIIGGRYGSVDETGISYTEQEYDYAVNRGIYVIALVHDSPGDILVKKSEEDPAAKVKLEAFKAKVRKSRLVKPWRKPEELPGIVALSLTHAIHDHQTAGWVRGDKPASEKILSEINELRKENTDLQNRSAALELLVAKLSSAPPIEDLAGLDEYFTASGSSGDGAYVWSIETTWGDTFGDIAPYLQRETPATWVKDHLATSLFTRTGKHGTDIAMVDQDFQTIAIQLQTLGLISIDLNSYWQLTNKGTQTMIELRTHRKGGASGYSRTRAKGNP
jgi:hypothetical protein